MKPILGHYSVGVTVDDTDWEVRVVPVPKSGTVLLALVSRGGANSLAVRLPPGHAKRIATGLTVSAEQIERPYAVLAKDAEEE